MQLQSFAPFKADELPEENHSVEASRNWSPAIQPSDGAQIKSKEMAKGCLGVRSFQG